MANLRWGLIGCGDIAQKRVAPALRDAAGSELLAVARARADLAEHFAREVGASKSYRDWRDLLADPEIDAVYIATPVDLHAGQAIAAAEAGKHVLCEKPMAFCAADCDRMIAACDANGVKLGVAYYRRFYPVIQRVRALIEHGEIGQVVLVQMNAFSHFNPQPGESRHWLLEKDRSGGGPMMDFGCHRIEILVNLFSPVEIDAAFVDQIFYKRQVEDTGGVLFRMGGGCRGVLLVTHATPVPVDTVEVWGSEGSLHIGHLNRGDLRVKTAQGERTEQHPPHANLHQPLVEDFLCALEDSREPGVSGEVGREVSRLLERIYHWPGTVT